MPRKNGFNPEGMDKRAIIYERQIPRGPESLSQEHLYHPEFEGDVSGLKKGRPYQSGSEKFLEKTRRRNERKKSFGITLPGGSRR